ncbi:MAG: hypothetical protein ACW964_03575 [Candidatus Hodarchaeales archaeon]|jgi:hypothetical protein
MEKVVKNLPEVDTLKLARSKKKYLRVYECPHCLYDPNPEREAKPVLSLDKWCPACMREIPKENQKIVWAYKDQKVRWWEFG